MPALLKALVKSCAARMSVGENPSVLSLRIEDKESRSAGEITGHESIIRNEIRGTLLAAIIATHPLWLNAANPILEALIFFLVLKYWIAAMASFARSSKGHPVRSLALPLSLLS